jgi:hypothetical protein
MIEYPLVLSSLDSLKNNFMSTPASVESTVLSDDYDITDTIGTD